MEGQPKFTYDFVMGQLRMAAGLALAFAGGKGWLTPTDASTLLALITALGPLAVPWAWSIISNLGKVHVGSGSAAAKVASIEAVSPAMAVNAAAVVSSTLGNVASILLAAFLLTIFLGGDPASAQNDPIKQFNAKVKKDLSGPQKTKTASATTTSATDPLTTLVNDISAKSADFVVNVVSAIQEADADASTLSNASDPTSFRDPISHACYPAQIQFLKSLPQIVAIKAPMPYNLIVLFQRKRDLIIELKAGLPTYLKLACSALLGDEKTIFIQTLGLIGVTGVTGALTGLFPAAAPITLPALSLGL